MRPGSPGAFVSSLYVHLDKEIPVLVLEVLEGYVSQNTRVIDEDVDPPEGLDGSLDDAFAVLDRVVVGDGLATCGFDLIDDDIGSLAM